MYIRRLVIADIRNFEGGDRAADVSFTRPDGSHAGWTVVTGRNGAGKSTFLRALAAAVAGPEAAAKLLAQENSWVRNGAPTGSATVELEATDGLDGRSASRGATPAKTVTWTWPDAITPVALSELANGRAGPWAANPRGWFIAGYGAFRRAGGATSEAAREARAGAGHVALLASLFFEDAPIHDGVAWLTGLGAERGRASDALRAAVQRLADDQLMAEVGHSGGRQAIASGSRLALTLLLDLCRLLHERYGELPIDLFDLNRQSLTKGRHSAWRITEALLVHYAGLKAAGDEVEAGVYRSLILEQRFPSVIAFMLAMAGHKSARAGLSKSLRTVLEECPECARWIDQR